MRRQFLWEKSEGWGEDPELGVGKSYPHAFSICERFLHGEWGTSRGSRRKWRQFRRRRAEFDPSRDFPEDLQVLVGELRAQVSPLIEAASRR